MKSLYLSLLSLVIFNIVNAIEIKIWGFLYADPKKYDEIVDRINEHFKKQGKDITLKAQFDTEDTNSGNPEHIASYIEDSLQKKENGFDIYITDTVYTGRFAKHFEDLYKYVDKDVIDLYKDGTATKTCIVDTKLAGLPLNVDYGGLYSNMDLLNKYNRKVPETWDELIETTNYIYDRESPTNPELHKYLAHFPEYENGLVTILEFMHSFRDSPTDKFPDYTSDNAAAAIEKMREVRNKASTPDDFAANELAMAMGLFAGKYIFARFWFVGETIQGHNATFSHLPGKVKGVSGSCVGGTNVSMNRYISEERKKAAGEILSYLHSYENQKYFVMKGYLKSAIHSTYRDEEICQTIDCVKFSSMQSIVRPSSSSINYDEYSNKFRELVREFVDGDTEMSAKEILIEVDDLRKIHFVEVNSMASIIILSITLITIILLLLSYIYISIKRFRQQFVFLPFNYWCIVIFGILLMTLYCITGIHRLNNYNCLIKPFLLSTGFDLIYVPLLLKMISIFPNKKGVTKFVKDHFSLLFILVLIVNIGLNIAWYILDPYVVNKLMVTSGKNFQYCSSSTFVGDIFKYLIYSLKIVILLIMCVLVFAEWNLVAFKPDIRSITSTIYTNILIIGLFIIVEKINIDNRYLYIGLRSALVLVFCLSTLFIIIGSKFYQISVQKENPYPDITTFNKSTSSGINSTNYYPTNNMNNTTMKTQNKSTLLNYHFQTGAISPTTSKPYPTLFTSTINSNYNDKLFNNSSSNNTQSSESFSNSKYSNSKSNLYSNNNFSTNNYANNNNYSNNNYSMSSYSQNNNYSSNYSNNNYSSTQSNNNYSNNNFGRYYDY